jgi:hypothetical protein
MNSAEFHVRLCSYLTQWDVKQSKKRFHNPHALGIYFQAADDARAKFEHNGDVREILLSCFCDRLLSFLLKSFGQTDFTAEEMKSRPIYRN